MADMEPVPANAITVKIKRSWAAYRPDGAISMVLDTDALGPIAFLLSDQAIAILRQNLTDAELLGRPAGGRS